MDTPHFDVESMPGTPVDLSPLVDSKVHLFRNGKEMTEGKDYRETDIRAEVEAMDWPEVIDG